MTISKNHNLAPGFTLIEAMIAVLMLGIIMSSIFVLQNQTFTSVERFTQRLVHTFDLTRVLVDAAAERERGVPADKVTSAALVGEQKDAQAIISYAVEKPKQGSALASFENVAIERATAEWADGAIKRSVQLMSLIFVPPAKEEKKA